MISSKEVIEYVLQKSRRDPNVPNWLLADIIIDSFDEAGFDIVCRYVHEGPHQGSEYMPDKCVYTWADGTMCREPILVEGPPLSMWSPTADELPHYRDGER